MRPGLRWRKHRLGGRAAWQLRSDRLRLELLEGGGHVASIELLGDGAPAGINPLWTPPWPGIEPYRFSPQKHGKIYGRNSESALLSGVRGHNVCFDYWGAPSPQEAKSGMSFHGEAGIIRWIAEHADVRGSELRFAYEAPLPASAALLARTVYLRGGEPVVYFEEIARNFTVLDRPIGWVEHVTVGPPFLRRGETWLDLPGTRGYSLAGAIGRVPPKTEFHWPLIPRASGGRTMADLRVAAPEQRSGFDLAVLLDPAREYGFVAASTPSLRLLVAYIFRRSDFPWVNVWEQNRVATTAPWRGRTLAVGLEFGNTIVPGSRRAMAAFPEEVYGAPTYGWLDAAGTRTVRYLALLAEIPADFRGVADIGAGRQALSIIERDNARHIRIPCNAQFLA